jgi:penicillin-binding protein 1B
MTRRKRIILLLSALFLLLTGTGVQVYTNLQVKLHDRLGKGWVLPPLELYSQGVHLSVGRRVPTESILDELRRRDLKPERDYVLGEAEACAIEGGPTLKENAKRCFWLKHSDFGPVVITWDENDWITEVWAGEPLAEVNSTSLFPKLITQFTDGQPIQQTNTRLSDTPLVCLQAVTAIEDRDFLEHMGISPSGILRAMLRNLKSGRFAEGGSTITQQLVKVFLLNSKKTLRRKVEEQMLALIMESEITKDQILEMYLNVIYMGQNGPYQVRGMASAAQYYFDKSLGALSLSDCAMLAALINNPGKYSPFNSNHEPARTRRELVLKKMVEANMISQLEADQAKSAPFPKIPVATRRAHAPYFVMSALKEFAALNLDSEEGARLYTTLDLDLQNTLINSILVQIPGVEKRIKKPSKQPLQVASAVVDLANGEVLALSGGRDFKTTQFNRARDSRRQIGSTVKPFVYLPAMESHDPLSEIEDAPFEWKVGRNVWKPKNYDGKYHGIVPYFYALAESLNVPAAKVSQEVGLDAVAETLKNAGAKVDIPELPSLSLGALELSPLELAQLYTTLARLGDGVAVHSLTHVEDLNGHVLFTHRPMNEYQLDPKLSAVVIGMLQQSLEVGTAVGARKMGLTGVFAGKTGTTSDTKDAWFVGFSPQLLTVVWVGYDDNTPMGLTGGGAALPIWTQFYKDIAKLYAPMDFKWPDGVRRVKHPRSELINRYPEIHNMPEEIEFTVKD